MVLLSREEKVWAEELRRRSLEVPALVGIIIGLQQQRTVLLTKFFALYRDLGMIINEGLQSETERGLAAAKADVIEAGEAANARILAVLLLSVAFGIVAGVVTTRSITRPLRHMVSVMDAVARGDRLRKVELTSSDEFRSLGDAFNHMTAQLAEAERQRLDGLRIFAISVQRAQEEERARISRELHDDLCQRLSGMKFRVEALEDDVSPAGKQISGHLHEVTEELDRSIAEVRRISSNLRPSVLDDFGIVAALRMLCKDFEKRQGISRGTSCGPGCPRPNRRTCRGRDVQNRTGSTRKYRQACPGLGGVVAPGITGHESASCRSGRWEGILSGRRHAGTGSRAWIRFDQYARTIGAPRRESRCPIQPPPAARRSPYPSPSVNRSTMAKTRILIADDHDVVRSGLRVLLRSAPDFSIVGEAADGEEAVRLAAREKPDVVIMDISMPILDGIEATKLIKERQPEVKVVIMSVHEDEEYVYQILRAGASGYVLKNAGKRDIFEAVRITPCPGSGSSVRASPG